MDLDPGFTRADLVLESVVMCLGPVSMLENLGPGSRETIHVLETTWQALMTESVGQFGSRMGWEPGFIGLGQWGLV